MLNESGENRHTVINIKGKSIESFATKCDNCCYFLMGVWSAWGRLVFLMCQIFVSQKVLLFSDSFSAYFVTINNNNAWWISWLWTAKAMLYSL